MTTLTRRYRFSASHRLHTPKLSDEENARLFGKCNNPFGHGHDYGLEVTIGGRVDRTSGLIVPIFALDELVGNAVLKNVSHRNINADLAQFSSLVATTENLARVIADMLAGGWPEDFTRQGVRLLRVQIQETDRNGFEYFVRARPQRAEQRSVEERVFVNA